MSLSPASAAKPTDLPGPEGYCTSQLIPYLGNKRSLLPRLRPVLERLSMGRPALRFLDPFSGSGSVSRLARAMGMEVSANDWEPYSEALNACWLALRPSDIDRAFGGREGLSSFLDDWNSMHPLAEAGHRSAAGGYSAEPYIARWYAPRRTEEPRIGEERLFYSAENAAFIDRARSRLEAEYPRAEPGSREDIRRRVILGGILLEAAVHANTSGVFKAYHRGFGGNGKDALTRILGRMSLEAPILPEALPAAVYREDARDFISRRSADIVYFDPPYNQHQYGSNYHLLNTILRWDGRPMPMEAGNEADFSTKAGIPVVWKATRSPFCVKREAGRAIAALLDACDAAKLVFSWNADGHLSGEDMVELLARRGRLEIVALDYVSYRGGRQSAQRSARSREYLFVVDARAERSDERAAKDTLSDLAARDEAVRSTYDPGRVSKSFGIGMELFATAARDDRREEFPEAAEFFRSSLRRSSEGAGEVLESMPPERRRAFMERLESCACSGIAEELTALAAVARRAIDDGDLAAARRASKEAPRLIRKLAHEKYHAEFRRFIALFESIYVDALDEKSALRLRALEGLMRMRTGGD